jgi:hypothetical protein
LIDDAPAKENGKLHFPFSREEILNLGKLASQEAITKLTGKIFYQASNGNDQGRADGGHQRNKRWND